MKLRYLFFASLVCSPLSVLAEDSVTAPRPVPLTRPEMKRLLEDMKNRKPRIPLPELTAEEKEKLASETPGRVGGGYEGRLRSLYLGGGGFNGGGGRGAAGTGNGTGEKADASKTVGRGGPVGQREQEPGMTLTNAFKVELFWIVSRTNNCQYCMGHQESKLLNAGLKEDDIAALDSNWAHFSPAEQVAFAYARKFTHEPNKLSDADIEGLKKHYTDLQILEMSISMAGNNAINRWKEGVGVPQSSGGGGFGSRGAAPAEGTPRPAQTYLTPTSEEFTSVITKVAPFQLDEKTGKPTTLSLYNRPKLESRDEVEKGLAVAKTRQPRLPLVDEAKAREVYGEDWKDQEMPQWARLLANFPREGKSRALGIKRAEETGDLKPLLKAQTAWIIARQDRAWYATGLAKKKLTALGVTEDDVYKLDGSWDSYSPADRAMFTVARKLAASPVILTDADVDEAVKQAGPRDVVQLINFITTRAAFDRITEAAGLQLE
ncbi:MAG: carboxymuconolactone decarboxylase family protein [Pirellulaceae bacterium]|nr:carboxymuconolactone decarboxylase family protein [Pirellulaceae bacterium]